MSILSAFFLAAVTAVFAEESIGRVIAIEGKATAVRAGGKSAELQIKSDIYLNDKITTGKGGKVQIMFNDDTVISQGENSEMTIDEYVYSKKNEKDSSCSMKLLTGVFRTVTGKVTKLNPERFKVHTRMATIGIRGCELGFKVQPTREEVYILELSKGESILIESAAALAREGLDARQNIINVIQSGIAVQIQAGAALKERPITGSEFMKILHESSPGSKTPESLENEQKSQGSGAQSSSQVDIEKAAETVNQARAAGQLAASLDALSVPQTKGQEELPPKPPPPTTAPYVAPPTSPPPLFTLGAPDMTDWTITLYEDGSSQYEPTTVGGASFVTPSEFSSILAGATVFRATPAFPPGFGMAGAVVTDVSSGYKATVQGSCNLTVTVGGGTASWGGSFSMSGGGDSLNFTVGSGNFALDGKMTLGSLSAYDLTVNGKTFNAGTLTASSVEGSLIKPGLWTPPISGAAGKFDFANFNPANGASATAKGTFGTDLR